MGGTGRRRRPRPDGSALPHQAGELATVISSWADWDVDGAPDLMVLQYPPNGVIAYLNEGGSYRRARIEGITGKPLHAAAWGDYDGDGRSDVALMSLSRLRIFR